MEGGANSRGGAYWRIYGILGHENNSSLNDKASGKVVKDAFVRLPSVEDAQELLGMMKTTTKGASPIQDCYEPGAFFKVARLHSLFTRIPYAFFPFSEAEHCW